MTRMSMEEKEKLAHSSTLEEKVMSVKINEMDQDGGKCRLLLHLLFPSPC